MYICNLPIICNVFKDWDMLAINVLVKYIDFFYHDKCFCIKVKIIILIF